MPIRSWDQREVLLAAFGADSMTTLVLEALVENHETVKAIELATAMLDRANTTEEKADAYVARARVYERIGETDRSIADYSGAIQLDPKLAQAYLGRGLRLSAEGRARQGSRRLLRGDPAGFERRLHLHHAWQHL